MRWAGPARLAGAFLAAGALLAAGAVSGAPAAARAATGSDTARFGAEGSGDWARVSAGRLVLEGPESYRPLLEELAGRARVFVPELERSLGVRLAAPVTMVVIPPDPEPYPAVARLDRAAPPWAAGFAIASWRIGGLRIARADVYPFGDPAAVLAHEVAHFLLHDAGGDDLPRWFSEGVATRVQRSWGLRDAFVYSSNLMIGPLPSLRQLDRSFSGSARDARLAYAASFDFVDWAAGEYGEDVVRRVLRGARTRRFDAAWREATGVSLSESEAGWRRTSLALYRWIPAITGAGGLWLAITALFLVATWGRKRRTRRLYDRWADEESERTQRDGRGRWVN